MSFNPADSNFQNIEIFNSFNFHANNETSRDRSYNLQCSAQEDVSTEFTHNNMISTPQQFNTKCLNSSSHASITDGIMDSKPVIIHHTRKDEGKSHHCEECKKSFRSPASLANHNRRHASEKLASKKFKCPFCLYSFQYRRNLKKHLTSFHEFESEVNVDELCPEESSFSSSMHLKKQFNQTLLSSEDKISNSHQNSPLSRPQNILHSLITGQKRPINDESVFSLQITNNSPIDVRLPPANSNQCLSCGKVCSSKQKLRHHMDRHDVLRKFACDVPGCERAFRTLKYLENHKASLHVRENVFRCEYSGCEFACIRHSLMVRHVADMHIRTSHFPNPDLTANFYVEDRQQTSRVFACPICRFSTIYEGQLEIHLSEDHPNGKLPSINDQFQPFPITSIIRNSYSPVFSSSQYGESLPSRRPDDLSSSAFDNFKHQLLFNDAQFFEETAYENKKNANFNHTNIPFSRKNNEYMLPRIVNRENTECSRINLGAEYRNKLSSFIKDDIAVFDAQNSMPLRTNTNYYTRPRFDGQSDVIENESEPCEMDVMFADLHDILSRDLSEMYQVNKDNYWSTNRWSLMHESESWNRVDSTLCQTISTSSGQSSSCSSSTFSSVDSANGSFLNMQTPLKGNLTSNLSEINNVLKCNIEQIPIESGIFVPQLPYSDASRHAAPYPLSSSTSSAASLSRLLTPNESVWDPNGVYNNQPSEYPYLNDNTRNRTIHNDTSATTLPKIDEWTSNCDPVSPINSQTIRSPYVYSPVGEIYSSRNPLSDSSYQDAVDVSTNKSLAFFKKNVPLQQYFSERNSQIPNDSDFPFSRRPPTPTNCSAYGCEPPIMKTTCEKATFPFLNQYEYVPLSLLKEQPNDAFMRSHRFPQYPPQDYGTPRSFNNKQTILHELNLPDPENRFTNELKLTSLDAESTQNDNGRIYENVNVKDAFFIERPSSLQLPYFSESRGDTFFTESLIRQEMSRSNQTLNTKSSTYTLTSKLTYLDPSFTRTNNVLNQVEEDFSLESLPQDSVIPDPVMFNNTYATDERDFFNTRNSSEPPERIIGLQGNHALDTSLQNSSVSSDPLGSIRSYHCL